jgi:aspartate/glutamate racemase
MPEECFGLVGGLGVGAAIHYYRQLAKAHDELHLPMNLAMVHANMGRMINSERVRVRALDVTRPQFN